MIKLVIWFLNKVSNCLAVVTKKLKKKFTKESVQADRIKPWFKLKGDKTFRLDYDLTHDSVVFDLGGYEGSWASDIYCKYSCNIFIFEPVQSFATQIKARFLMSPKVKIFQFGLGKNNDELKIHLDKDGSSLYGKKTSEHFETIEIKRADIFLLQENIRSIDLMKINIEGGEYDLLAHLIECGLINEIKNIQVQFHDFVDNAEARMKEIQEGLARTHQPTYQYEFVWENWKRKQ